MAQIFHPSMNTISRVSIFGAVFFIVAAFLIGGVVVRSPYVAGMHVIRQQPVEFSHQHHVSDCGIDCRYCHTSVERSPFAGIPATEVCMNCHSYLWSDSPMLAPVQESFRTGQPIRWTRVHDIADFAYFDHSIHIHKGIGCVSCHGRVDEMPLTWAEFRQDMQWCLDCHRHPAQHVRPREFVFTLASLEELAENEELPEHARFREYLRQEFPGRAEPVSLFELRQHLAEKYGLKTKTSCSYCHR